MRMILRKQSQTKKTLIKVNKNRYWSLKGNDYI